MIVSGCSILSSRSAVWMNCFAYRSLTRNHFSTILTYHMVWNFVNGFCFDMAIIEIIRL